MTRSAPGLRALLLTVSLLGGLWGCRLTDVSLPGSEDVLVVEAVLRAGARQQYVLLHRSMDGLFVRGEPGASVRVAPLGGNPVDFMETGLLDCLTAPPEHWNLGDLTVDASCYVSPIGAGRFVRPGGEYELFVESDRGEVVRGRTQVPGIFSFRVPAVQVNPTTLTASCALPTRPFTMTWTRSEGAWSYLASLRLADWGEDLRGAGVEVPDPVELTGVAVSAMDTTLNFPGDLGVFQRADFDQRIFQALQKGLPAGADASIAILAADRNFTNGIRGGRFNPSGTVRPSSVVGDGVGVFGSIVPLVIRSVQEPPAVPRCSVPAP